MLSAEKAEVVRREWLTGLLGRKILPKDANQFVSVVLSAHRTTVAGGLSRGSRLAATLLGLDERNDPVISRVPPVSPMNR